MPEMIPPLPGLLKRKGFPNLGILRWCLKDEQERAWEAGIGRQKRWTFPAKLNIATAKLRRWETALVMFRGEAGAHWRWG